MEKEERCKGCGNEAHVEDFKDAISLQEYEKYTGFCQSCQDRLYGKPLTEEEITEFEALYREEIHAGELPVLQLDTLVD